MILKRTVDIALSVVAAPPVFLVGGIVALAIKLDDRGPVFFVQERIGANQKPFRMYKFRSMKVDAPVVLSSDGSTVMEAKDPRVTRVGRVIRTTSIDELPQLFNVLKGDMSWVGPRPSLLSALGSFKDDELAKFKVRPGITGYTQAYYRNSLTNREKRIFDAWYAENRSFGLDFRIIFRTIRTVLSRENQIPDGI